VKSAERLNEKGRICIIVCDNAFVILRSEFLMINVSFRVEYTVTEGIESYLD
jgi:hypothetical protein